MPDIYGHRQPVDKLQPKKMKLSSYACVDLVEGKVNKLQGDNHLTTLAASTYHSAEISLLFKPERGTHMSIFYDVRPDALH
jgi:hypothetical protein